MIDTSLSAGDGVALLALAVSIWTVFQTTRFNRRQNDFAQTAERLNQLLIERESAESQQQRKAEVSANFIKIGKSTYRLKVYNRGAVSARNVRLAMLTGGELIGNRELDDKFPIPKLDRQQSIEMIAFVHMQSPRRAHIRLEWDDDTGANHQNEMWLDVF